jgi:hypothetical protein
VKEHALKKPAIFIGKLTYNLLFLATGLIVVSIASYFFGFKLLRDPLAGSDAYSVLTYAVYVYNNLPQLPLWYPLQGAGESFLLGYPPLYPLTLALVSKFFALPILQSMSFLNFSTILFTALGAFLFVFFRFKNPVAAVIAAVFLLLSPFPYALVSGGGFLANAYTNIFTIFAFLFFDSYLMSFIKGESSKKTYLYLLFAGVFFVLGTLAHPVGTLGLMILSAIYFPLVGLLNGGQNGLIKGLKAFFLMGVVVFLMSWFWFKPFTDYTNFSNRDITFTADISTLPPLSLWSVLGLEKNSHELLVNLSVPPVVWIFAVIGSILSLFKKDKRVFALGVISAVSIILMGTHAIWYMATKINWLLGSFLVHRYYFTSTIILPPLVGAMGVWYLAELPFLWIKNNKIKIGTLPLITALAILLFYIGSTKTTFLSSYYLKSEPWVLPYGEEGYINTKDLWNRAKPGSRNPCAYREGDLKHNYRCDNEVARKNTNIGLLINICEENTDAAKEVICLGGRNEGTFTPAVQKDFDDFKLRCGKANESGYVKDLCLAFDKNLSSQLSAWPAIRLSVARNLENLETAQYASKDFGQRIDISPSIGAWVKEWNISNGSGLVNAYTGQLVLNKSFNSYFRDILYSNNLIKGSVAVSEIIKYFGVNGLILDTTIDPPEKLDELNWQVQPLSRRNTIFRTSPDPQSIYSLQNQSKVLVIGSAKNQAYMQIFRIATQGMIPFEKGLLFEGKENIDQYSAEELSNYNLIILHGAGYKNKTKAYGILKKYLENGGNIFMQTGWQYTAADWGTEDGAAYVMSEIVPVSEVKWNSKEIVNWQTAELDTSISEDVNVSGFEPLTWDGKPWSLAYAEPNKLRSWAKPLLMADGKVIIAGGNVGKGKIIWTGTNIFAHSMQNTNQAEIQLLNNTFDTLLPATESPTTVNLKVLRTNPDRVELEIPASVKSGAVVYFKENYYPYWKAELEGSGVKKLDVKIAGPRFMAIILREAKPGDKLVFTFKALPSFLAAMVFTLASLIGLFLLMAGKGIKIKTPKVDMGKIFKKSGFWDEDS